MGPIIPGSGTSTQPAEMPGACGTDTVPIETLGAGYGSPVGDEPGEQRPDAVLAEVDLELVAVILDHPTAAELRVDHLPGGARDDVVGLGATMAGDLDGDGYDDVAMVAWRTRYIIGPEDPYPDGLVPAYVVILYGAPDLTGVLRAQDAGALLRLDSPSARVARVGDLDADGFDDLVIANTNAGWDCTEGSDSVYVVYGGRRLAGMLELVDVGVALRDDYACRPLFPAGVGDFDGDGVDDFVITAWPHRDGAPSEVSIMYGARRRLASGALQAASSAQLVTRRAGESMYFSRGVGNVDGDDATDLLLQVDGGGEANRLVLFHGSKERFYGTIDIDGVSRRADVATAYASYGSGSIGDIDLDGASELCIDGGDPHGPDGYAVFYGGAETLTADLESDSPGTRLRWGTDSLAGSPELVGDFNGDAMPDFLLGNSTWDDTRGAAALVLGNGARLPAEANLEEIPVILAGRVYPEERDRDGAGATISSNADVNGDGLSDILVGGPRSLTAPPDVGGRIYLVYGRR